MCQKDEIILTGVRLYTKMKVNNRSPKREYFHYLSMIHTLFISNSNRISLPFIGSIHAGKTVGFPNPSEEETSETVDLADLLQVDMYAAKLFRVRGDSMVDAGIFNEDILLVECTDKYRLGDIVIAEIDGEETVKYIRKTYAGKLYLQAANPDIKDMHPQEYLKVKAVIKTVIRRYG